MYKLRMFLLCALLVVSALVLAACQPKEVVGEFTPSVVEVMPNDEMLEPLPYNLKPGKPYDGTEITFLLCCQGTPQFQAWQRRSAEFTELTGIKVKFSYEPWGSYQSRIVAESISGTGSFDVVNWLDTFGPSFQQTLLPLEPLIERDGIDYADDYPPAFMQAGKFNDHIYGFPVRTHAFVLFYRQDVFDELGLDVPQTWDDLLEVGRVIEANTDLAGIANYMGVGAGQNLYPWALMLWGEGGDFFDEDYKPIFNNEAGVRATERYMSLREIGQESQFTAYEGMARESLATGESAMIVGWWWFYSMLNDPNSAAEEVAGNIGFAPVPSTPGRDPVGFALSFPVGISSFSRNPDASWEFIKWLSNPAIDKAVVMDKSDPATSDIVASHTSVLSDPEVNEVNGGIHAAALPGLMNSYLMPLIPEWAEVNSILDVTISDIALGADIQTRLDEAAADIEAVMDRAGYYK